MPNHYHVHNADVSTAQILDAAMLTALRRLARPPNRLSPPVSGAHQRAIAAAGWVVADRETGAVRLTVAGRTVLRRALSDGGMAKATVATAVPRPSVGTAAAPGSLPSSSTVLRWLRQRRDRNGQPLLTELQVEAGERLAADFVRGQMTPRVTADWSPTSGGAPRRRGVPGHGVELREATAAAQDRFRAGLAAVEPEFADLLINVCCFDARIEDVEKAMNWPQRSAKILLQLALNQLARHYGLMRRGGPTATIRHAGCDDYRPGFEVGV